MKLAHLLRRMRNRDRLAIAAMVIALLAIVAEVAFVLPLELQVQHKKAAAAARTPNLAHAGAAADSPRAQLAAFYGQLPSIGEARDLVHRLHSHARDAGLQLDRGEYRPPTGPASELLRYQVVLPVTGTYPQVRRFLMAAMQDMPNLALDAVDFRREPGSPPRVEAQLRFTGFMRGKS